MMKYKIMHRDSVIAEANGFEVTEILSFDFNQELIGSWLPEIATYMKETAQALLNNEKALEIMKRNALNRTSIAYAANYAEKCVKQHMADAFNEMFFPWVNNQVLQMAEFLLSWLEKS